METVEAVIPIPRAPKDICPICEKAPHPDRTTMDKKEKKGCLKSIPGNLGCAQIPKDPLLPSYATAAHHVIPAIQCLQAFPRLVQMCDTVGYDVNNSANGMPLPTCGQQHLNAYVNQAGALMKFGKLEQADKQNAAFVIMAGLDRQWHVGHHNWAVDVTTDSEVHPPNYDQLVKTKLRDLEKDARQEGDSICEPPDDSESGSSLIAELNSLSGEIKGQVTAWVSYYVSAMSYAFAVKYRR